ncbi:MAG: hypothetical protein J6B81_02175 [Spirochaetaceae bacterium]|nr:hypothetical protein [Spirochaetaceae bacterium]
MSVSDSCKPIELTYSFSAQEIKLLAKFFRKASLPDGLEKFRDKIFKSIYESMTLDQAESFFKD